MKSNKTFMSLNKISYGYSLNPKWAVDKWLSEPTTLEFIQLWESLHNLDFDTRKYIELCSSSLSMGCCPSIEELKEKCHVISIFADRAFSDNIFIHKDLAMDFASWASPSFRTFCLLLLRQGVCDMQLNFNSEEDFIISSKTLAEFTKQNALKNFQNSLCEFVYNCQCV